MCDNRVCVAFDVLNVLNGTATGGFSRDASAFVASRVALCRRVEAGDRHMPERGVTPEGLGRRTKERL
jgi:hypothetical protein